MPQFFTRLISILARYVKFESPRGRLYRRKNDFNQGIKLPLGKSLSLSFYFFYKRKG